MLPSPAIANIYPTRKMGRTDAKADGTLSLMPLPSRVDNSESIIDSYVNLKLGIEVHMLGQ